MKLSDAIREGSQKRPQGFGMLMDLGGNTCALGAALDSINQLTRAFVRPVFAAQWLELFPILAKMDHCPHGECRLHSIVPGAVIAHLNDNHRWSREAIAMWVETIEKQYEPAKETADDAHLDETAHEETAEVSTAPAVV